MKIVMNDSLEPVRLHLKDAAGKLVKVIIPGKGWRKVEEAQMTPALDAALAAGTLTRLPPRQA